MKKPIIIINTFKTINIPEDKKPIVICDIDMTFIRPSIENKSNYSKPKHLNQIVNYILNLYINSGLVKQTDEQGFKIMLEKINQLGGKLIFLTARSYLSHEKTINDLIKAGLQNPQQFEIHYTGNQITKGQYIQRHNLLKGYDHHIFVDDYPPFLESALQLYPDMNCYLFNYI
jgi:predicted secreted acid phosphatase